MNEQEHPAFTAIREVAERTQIIVTFYTDLTKWDRLAINKRPDQPFIWMQYQRGTHIVFIDGDPRNRTAGLLDCFRRNFPEISDQIYHWDGEQLHWIKSHAKSYELFQAATEVYCE